MLLSVDNSTMHSERVRGSRLFDLGYNEADLQQVLFNTLDRLIPDEELVVIMQSTQWREEPDLMAIDKLGNLYIFELKAWESSPENLLQVFRYGQIFGKSTYEDLNKIYNERIGESKSLSDAHNAKFGTSLHEEEYNLHQIFIVITNGLDFKTREAVRYWCGCGLDVRPWVYRVYNVNSSLLDKSGDNRNSQNISTINTSKTDKTYSRPLLLEINPFRICDNPYEDTAEGYYILNTNSRNDIDDHNDMIKNKKAAAYFDPWKYKIERISKGDVMFLYQSGVGIVAFGDASGKLAKCNYHGDVKHKDEEYYRQLTNFKIIYPPLSAAEIKAVTGNNYVFMGTLFGIDVASGKKIKSELLSRSK